MAVDRSPDKPSHQLIPRQVRTFCAIPVEVEHPAERVVMTAVETWSKCP